MGKLTKQQLKTKERIDAWLKGIPFKENSKAKPAVPMLDTLEVMDSYIPPEVEALGQYFTPLEMALDFYHYTQRMRPTRAEDKVIDLCAGIGNLSYQFVQMKPGLAVTCVEMSEEVMKVGNRLLPETTWINANIFDLPVAGTLEPGTFDQVIMNPPFNITCGTWHESSDVIKSKKSEHMALEIAMWLCKSNGVISVIAPYNYYDRMPKTLIEKIDTRFMRSRSEKLEGEFKLTKIQVYMHSMLSLRDNPFVGKKTSAPIQVPVPEPVQVASPAPEPAPAHCQHSIVINNDYGYLQRVDITIFAGLFALCKKNGGEFPPSSKSAVKMLLELGEKETAKWVRENPIEYGNVYFYGVTYDPG